jgi:hypothetical protein
MRENGYSVRVSSKCVSPRILKDESCLKNPKDKRRVPLVGSADRKVKDMSRINPVANSKEFARGRGSLAGALSRVQHEGVKEDYSKAGVKRACASFALEQRFRSLNCFRGRMGKKYIPMNSESLKKFKQQQGN